MRKIFTLILFFVIGGTALNAQQDFIIQLMQGIMTTCILVRYTEINGQE